jgi:hypothetical protein
MLPIQFVPILNWIPMGLMKGIQTMRNSVDHEVQHFVE